MPYEVVEQVCPADHAALLKRNDGKLVDMVSAMIKIRSVDLDTRRVTIEHVRPGLAGLMADPGCVDAIAYNFLPDIANFLPYL